MAGSILRSRRIPIDAGLRAAAYLAAALAFGSAAISLFWTAGGSWLLDTVGGEFETLAWGRSVRAMSLGGATVALKLAAGVLIRVGSMVRRVGRGARVRYPRAPALGSCPRPARGARNGRRPAPRPIRSRPPGWGARRRKMRVPTHFGQSDRARR